MLENKAHELADQAIAKPALLNQLNDDTMIKFAIGVARYSKDKAHKLIDLKYYNLNFRGHPPHKHNLFFFHSS